jgi:putative membrane protein
MELRYLIAVLHLLALAIGIAAVYARGRALRRVGTEADAGAVFHADNWYGVAAVLWVATGLWRAFGGLEKGTAHYVESPLFLGKMGLFGLVLLLELWPMVALVRWRMQRRRGVPMRLGQAPLLAWLSFAQLPLYLGMVLLAAALARGL